MEDEKPIGGQFIEKWLEMPTMLRNACDAGSPYFRYNDFFRFFCCYLAFNHIYDAVNTKCPRHEPFLFATRKRGYLGRQEWTPSERERILVLVDDAVKKIKKRCSGNPEWDSFEQGIGEVLLKPVVDSNIKEISPKKTHSIDGIIEYNDDEHILIRDLAEEYNQEKDEGRRFRLRIQMVFLRVYQVRCNLFHGDKDSNNDRDVALVKTAADVLERFLWFCVRDCHGEIW